MLERSERASGAGLGGGEPAPRSSQRLAFAGPRDLSRRERERGPGDLARPLRRRQLPRLVQRLSALERVARVLEGFASQLFGPRFVRQRSQSLTHHLRRRPAGPIAAERSIRIRSVVLLCEGDARPLDPEEKRAQHHQNRHRTTHSPRTQTHEQRVGKGAWPAVVLSGERGAVVPSPPVLERAALHQTRFRTPGVSPDARGVVLGQRGVVLFPSLDRLVAFLRAYGDEGSLDELLPSLEIRRLVTSLKTREIMLSVQAESSYRMDRIAGVAKLAGGLVFTGTSRHFVKYRDPASPLGYDVAELLDEAADLVLYHDSFQQAYAYEREISFRDLVLKLTPHRVPPGGDPIPDRLFATAEVGIGGALVGYLFRWRVTARAALAEWPSQSAFSDAPRRLYVFDIAGAPARVVALMQAIPGVHVFAPLGETFAVELGFRHPISLESCASLFDKGKLYLFRGDGEVELVDPLPPFAPVRSLVRTDLSLEKGKKAGPATPKDVDLSMSLPLRLAPSSEPWRNVVSAVIPGDQREWLSRLLYALPPNTLAALRMAIGEDRIYLIDRSGIEGVPLGVYYCEVAERIYVPAGLTLVPAVASAVLEELVRDRGDGHVYFEPGRSTPIVIPATAFGPISRRALREVGAAPVSADRPDNTEPPLPLLQYDDARRFPLWGVPGKKLPDAEAEEEEG